MLPAQRRQVVQQFVRNDLSLAAQRLNGAPEVYGVPRLPSSALMLANIGDFCSD